MRWLCDRLRRPPAREHTRTVLIVDGSPEDRRSTRRVVEQLGYRAVEAADGEEASRRVAAERPARVLLALDLPGQSGLEVLRDLRAAQPDLGIIMLAPNWRDARTAEAMRRGAVAYLAKPFGANDLRELLPA
jgi:two-component system response regulator RegA